MIDWNKRKEELNNLTNFDDKGKFIYLYDKIIEQEQSMFKQLEADKAELLEAFKSRQRSIANVQCTNCRDRYIKYFCNACIYNFNQLIQKMEGGK